MAYERFWEAVEGYKRGEDLLFVEASEGWAYGNSFKIFEGLFSVHNSPVFDREGTLLGNRSILTGVVHESPTNDMLEELKSLEIPDTTYRPDEESNLGALAVAANVKGAILFTKWRLTGYGDDVPSLQRELEQLFARDDRLRWHTLCGHVYQLSKYIGAELAYQNGDYEAALVEFASSAKERYQPWFESHKTTTYFEALKSASPNNIDWQRIAEASNSTMVSYTIYEVDFDGDDDSEDDYSEVDYHRTVDEGYIEKRELWFEIKTWAEAQLTSEQLRRWDAARADEAAAQRLRTYFFPGGMWEQLPERAQQALVTADRQMVTGTALSRGANIFNELRIATEEVLHRYLWQPLSVWVKEQSKPPNSLKTVLAGAHDGQPSIGSLVQLLWTNGIKDYLSTAGVDDDGVRFLTSEKRTTSYLHRLQHERNIAEHRLDPGDDSADPRELYAEALGIGRKGVLPEMLRLLAPRPEPIDYARLLEGLGVRRVLYGRRRIGSH